MTTQSYIFLLCIRIFFTFTFFVFSIASLSWQNSCRSPEWRYWTHCFVVAGLQPAEVKTSQYEGFKLCVRRRPRIIQVQYSIQILPQVIFYTLTASCDNKIPLRVTWRSRSPPNFYARYIWWNQFWELCHQWSVVLRGNNSWKMEMVRCAQPLHTDMCADLKTLLGSSFGFVVGGCCHILFPRCLYKNWFS